jgi:Family of unknown function (DUF6510)
MDETPSYLDGNAAAGVLTEVFCTDVTGSEGQCAGCDLVFVLAQAHAYMAGPGIVLRCPGCGAVLLRVAQTPGKTWLDMTGLRHLTVAATGTG